MLQPVTTHPGIDRECRVVQTYRSSEIRGFLSLPRLEPRYWDGRRHLQDACFEHDNVRNHLRWLRFGGWI